MSQTAEKGPRGPRQRSSMLGPRAAMMLSLICTWPVLMMGSLTYFLWGQAINQQETVMRQLGNENLVVLEVQRQRDSLSSLLLGTGITALLAGCLAAIWARHSLRRLLPSASLSNPDTPEEMTRLVEQTTAVIGKLYRTKSREETLNTAVAEVRRILGADRVVVYSLDENAQGVFVAEAVVHGWPQALGATIRDPCFESRYTEKYQDGRVRATNDIRNASLTPCHLEQLAAFEVQANLVAPILNNGELKGLLIAHQCASPREWRSFETQWFAQVAIAIGLAVDNAQFLTELKQVRHDINNVTIEKQQQLESLRLQTEDALSEGNIAAHALLSEQQQQVMQVTTAIASIRALSTSVESMAHSSKQALHQHQDVEQTLASLSQSMAPILQSVKTFDNAGLNEAKAVLKRLNQPYQKLIKGLEYTSKMATQVQMLAIKAPAEATRRSGNSELIVSDLAEKVHLFTQQLSANTAELKSSAAQVQVMTHHVMALLDQIGFLEVDAQHLQGTVKQFQQLKIACTQMGEVAQHVQQSVAEQTRTSATAEKTVHDLANKLTQRTEQTEKLAQAIAQVDAAVKASLLHQEEQ
jgi:methyl-accepting chemotaxis protein PixJ